MIYCLKLIHLYQKICCFCSYDILKYLVCFFLLDSFCHFFYFFCNVFSESLAFTGRYGRMSHEVSSRIRYEALNQPARAASATLSREHILASPSICWRE